MPNPNINRRIIASRVSGPPPITMLPTDLAGLGVWWKADGIVGLNNGDPVTTWPDDNGSNDLTGAGATRPIYNTNVFGSMPAVFFDGTDDVLASTSNFGYFQALGASYFIVFSVPAGGGWILNIADGTNYRGVLCSTVNMALFDASFNGFSPPNPMTTSEALPRVIRNNSLNFRENKTDLGDTGGLWPNANVTYNRIGSWPAAAVFFKGYIAEIVEYPNAPVSDANSDALYNGYFYPKYFPALPL